MERMPTTQLERETDYAPYDPEVDPGRIELPTITPYWDNSRGQWRYYMIVDDETYTGDDIWADRQAAHYGIQYEDMS